MSKFVMRICLLSVASLILSSCLPKTGVVNPGAGYQSMTPKRATRVYMANNDRQFAEQVIVNNETCSQHVACKKNPTIKD